MTRPRSRYTVVLACLLAATCAFGGSKERPTVSCHFNVLSPRTPLLLRDRLLFAGWKDRLWVFDVREPANPKRVAELRVGGLVNDMAALTKDTLALVNGAELITVEVQDPAAPRLVHAETVGVPETHGPEGLTVRDGRAYVACRRQGLKVYGLSDPARPKLLGHCPLRGLAKKVILHNDRAFVATRSGVAIVDIHSLPPKLVSFYDSLRSAEEMVFRPPHMLIMSKEYFAALDFSEPSAPKPLGECTTIDLFYFRYPQQAVVSGNLVLTAQTEGGLYILDWSDPASPAVVAQYSTWERQEGEYRYVIATGVAFDGRDAAYVMSYDGRLNVFEVRRRRWKIEIQAVARTDKPEK